MCPLINTFGPNIDANAGMSVPASWTQKEVIS